MMPIQLSIRSVQHYLYCPHRWGLLEIDRAWAENFFVTKANLLHKRVHDPDNHYAAKGKKVFTSVPVYCDDADYCLYGIVDCLEAAKTVSGVPIRGLDGQYQLCIVEYKPTQPKNKTYNEDDLMQVFAQKSVWIILLAAIVMVCSIMLMLRKEYRCPYGSILLNMTSA